MDANSRDRVISSPRDRAADQSAVPHQTRAAKASRRKWVRISPTVSWYGKILVIGALLVTFGWELFHLIITLMTLD
ncbi:hypothetical protein TSA1_15710 [Bradyrhizobium nitroreducens]|uniref:Uncharacterized protein n=1 Tax=Bradyrhizobium nitroreducens TaxID=709803 RepID=A0A2M6UBR2_9BRAD|nr:hypothetical protein TSA1_15710 [Bradyrhizobium nitroreducens]